MCRQPPCNAATATASAQRAITGHGREGLRGGRMARHHYRSHPSWSCFQSDGVSVAASKASAQPSSSKA